MKKNETKSTQKKTQLVNRINNLEEKMEKTDRENRRNNIIIKGLERKEGNTTDQVQKFLKNELEVDVGVVRTHLFGANNSRKIIWAEIETWEQKLQILKNKNKLVQMKLKIYINNDGIKGTGDTDKNTTNSKGRE